MNLKSRKIFAFIINTVLFMVCFILSSCFAPNIIEDIASQLIYAQLLNTGLLLGTNSIDKSIWSRANIKNGKGAMMEGSLK